ncbi:MAG: penicillin-binding protein 2, partial [Patescibacteria group bacterium]
CLPDYDLEKYYEFSDAFFLNNAISNLYEPGSTFKPFIMAAALEEKKLKPTDVYNEEGPIDIGKYTIRTWDNKYEGRISATRILEKSSNVGMVWVGEKLGDKNIISYLKKFGMDTATGIDLQGEAKPIFKTNNQWYPIDYATATFGQGIAVTPIQMITAFSSLINGGELIQPRIVKKIISGDSEKEVDKKVLRKTISVNTSEAIKKMLYSTVENGEYKWVKPEGYKIGGKTGTAQIPIAGSYEASKTIASFIGFAPINNPKFIALVVLREPKTSIYGSETAAPLFFDIAKDLFVYYNIGPED